MNVEEARAYMKEHNRLGEIDHDRPIITY
jgi:hypothetical protein